MGNNFRMSIRFNKCGAPDFGLVALDDDRAIDPKDGSIWKKAKLYDFGWGNENGFYRSPLPSFDELFDMALHSDHQDDQYGAAAIILNRFPNELLSRCETLIKDPANVEDSQTLVDIFNLDRPINRCPINGKTQQQIADDYERWAQIAKFIAQY